MTLDIGTFFSTPLTLSIKSLITSVFMNSDLNDIIIWDASMDGCYSSKTAYKWINLVFLVTP